MRKTLSILILLILPGIYTLSARAGDPEITAYYFHATRRCATCQAVEKVSRETIAEKHKDEVKFVSVNREQDENRALVEKYKVGGQSLLLVRGDQVVDLTSTAFMYARTKPEKLEEKLSSTIKSML